jgi:sarcosine oxidase subunit gamma
MSLGFLTPEASDPRQVRARSPMERGALKAGARLSRLEGWNVPNAYGEPTVERDRLTRTVGFVDCSSLSKLELQAEPDVVGGIVAGAAGGLSLEPGLAARVAGAWWCPVTPGRVLVLCDPSSGAALRAAVDGGSADAGASVTVVDVSCGLAGLQLVGPGARELLARFCAIDVRPAVAPPGAFRPGSVARTPGYVLVENEDTLLVLVGWALGEYLWQVVADAAEHLGGGPVGAEALTHHLERVDA